MGFDNGAANGQSHPHPLRFGGVKRLEDAFDIFRGDTRPRIFDGNQYAGGFLSFRCYLQHAVPISHGVHRINSVDEQIQDDLLELYTVSHDFGQGCAQTSLNQNTSLSKIDAQELQNLLDQSVGIERDPFVVALRKH